MRRIGHLFHHFKSSLNEVQNTDNAAVTPADMLMRRNFDVLKDAIFVYTSGENDELKAGLKISLCYLLKKLCKIVKGSFLMNDRDNDANEIDKFLEVFSLNENLIFGDATNTLNNQRHKKLRRPEQLPTE